MTSPLDQMELLTERTELQRKLSKPDADTQPIRSRIFKIERVLITAVLQGPAFTMAEARSEPA